MRRHHERDVVHLFSRDLVQAREVLLNHVLQLIAPGDVGHGHHQHAIHKTESARLLRHRRPANHRPRQQRGLIARLAANRFLENFLERRARVLHGVNFDSRALFVSLKRAWWRLSLDSLLKLEMPTPSGLKFARRTQNRQLIGTAEEAAEKVKQQIPRGLKPARNDKK
jgi:hypothetical protein